MVLDPDYDVYPEQLNARNAQIAEIKPIPERGAFGVVDPASRVMRFKEDPEVHEMFGDFMQEARYL